MRKINYDDRHAFDSAALSTAVDNAARSATRALNDRRLAMDAVSKVTAPGALDVAKTETDVYRIGLDALGVDLRHVPVSAYKGLFHAARKLGQSGAASRASAAELAKQFPSTARIRKA
jgi:hypothetical protein